MKKIVVVMLCLLSVGAMAQKRTAAKRRPAAKKAIVAKRTTTKSKGIIAPPPPQPQTSNTMSTQAVDTSKKGSVKPFERPLDGIYKKNNIINARVTPQANIREADAIFSKRVWFEIDLREKMNNYIASPKSNLMAIIQDAVANGELTAYDPTGGSKEDPNGDQFAHPLTPAQAKAREADSVLVPEFDKNTGEKIGSHMVAGTFSPDSVIKFRVKEDWVFDKQRSVFEPRIIGIAPLIKSKVNVGNDVVYTPLYWIYFPEARQIFATKEISNRNNDATGLSYDDIFMKRLFTSYIVKVSNEKDERIQDYTQGINKLYESDKVKKSLMDWELNLWQY